MLRMLLRAADSIPPRPDELGTVTLTAFEELAAVDELVDCGNHGFTTAVCTANGDDDPLSEQRFGEDMGCSSPP